jgi:NhaP-type Na+/H+ or K+/H+ antiporter
MENMATVIILLAAVTVLAEITDKIRIPYPILLVLAGIGIGLFPGLPHITLSPEVVFLPYCMRLLGRHRGMISKKPKDLLHYLP